MEMMIRLKTAKLLSLMLPQSPPLYPICKELTAAVQECARGARCISPAMKVGMRNKRPVKLTMRRLILSIGGMLTNHPYG